MACSANEGAASEDRRITRSKQALREAFIELTEENGLDGFSASDLCARAGLNRGTGEKSRARADETRDVITALLAMREEWRHAQCR